MCTSSLDRHFPSSFRVTRRRDCASPHCGVQSRTPHSARLALLYGHENTREMVSLRTTLAAPSERRSLNSDPPSLSVHQKPDTLLCASGLAPSELVLESPKASNFLSSLHPDACTRGARCASCVKQYFKKHGPRSYGLVDRWTSNEPKSRESGRVDL